MCEWIATELTSSFPEPMAALISWISIFWYSSSVSSCMMVGRPSAPLATPSRMAVVTAASALTSVLVGCGVCGE